MRIDVVMRMFTSSCRTSAVRPHSPTRKQRKKQRKKNTVNVKREKKEKPPREKEMIPECVLIGHTPIYLIEASDSYKCNVPKRFSSLRRQFT